MPDSQILPRGRMLLPVPLPDGTLDDIRSRARRRRTERAAVAGSAAGVALVLAASVVLSGGLLDQRQDSLRIGPADAVVDVPPRPAPEPAQDVLSPPRVGSQGKPAAADVAPAAATSPPPVPGGEAAAAAVVTPAVTQPSPPTPARRYDADATRRESSTVTLPYCGQPIGPSATPGWCLGAMADAPGEVLSFEMCRAPGTETARLEWRDSQQVDFEVRNQRGHRIWTYDPRVRAEPSTYEVPADSCLRWDLAWPARDEQGRPLAQGTYTLTASTTATSLRGAFAETAFEVPSGHPTSTPPRPAPVPVPDACSRAHLPTSCVDPLRGD